MKVWLKKFLLSISTLLPITLLQVPISAEDLVREDVVIKADNVIEKEDMDEIDAKVKHFFLWYGKQFFLFTVRRFFSLR